MKKDIMQPYFFVPASKIDKLSTIDIESNIDIIIDFEDSIINMKKSEYLLQLSELPLIDDYWLRIPIREGFEDDIDIEFLTEVSLIGVNKIVIPKLKNQKELKYIISKFPNFLFIILLEHPNFLFEIEDFIREENVLKERIKGLGLGSHDLATFMGFSSSNVGMDYPKMRLLYLCKANSIPFIDVASMNIHEELVFIDELINGFDLGVDGKFLIHPNQLSWLRNFSYKKKNEKLKWAKSLMSKLPHDYILNNIEPFIFENIVVEKPHILRALNIIKKNKNGK